jgi:uncharacterized membrane protein
MPTDLHLATNAEQTPAADAERNPISIAFIFYLVTFASIIAAVLSRLTVNEQVTWQVLAASIVAGTVLGLTIGLLAGMLYFRSRKAALIGMGIGIPIGLCSGALVLVSDERFLANMAVTFAGCWLVIVMMLVSARSQYKTD